MSTTTYRLAETRPPHPPCSARRARAMPGALRLVGPLVTMLLLAACKPSLPDQARRLVVRYNDAVAKAYRRGDAACAVHVVTPREGQRIRGLIGIRTDYGLRLDSEMIALDVVTAERIGDELRVRTREDWRYCDRRVTTELQVGPPIRDSYEMLYTFQRSNHTWRVEGIQFVTPPQVGRTNAIWSGTSQSLVAPSRKSEGGPP